MGPLISRIQQERVLGHIDQGRKEGARVACGGSASSQRGFFVEPTVFADVDNTMGIARDEIFFWAVATVIPFAVHIANDSRYSLAAGVWTQDVTRAHLRGAGTAGRHRVDQHVDSGVGRDLGRAALDNYTEQKSVWLHLGKAA